MDQMRDVLDVLDLVEAQIQAGQITEFIQTLDVRDKVVIEVQFFHGLSNV
jgi:DNA-directed RNA polymerase specialized sigma subunit